MVEKIKKASENISGNNLEKSGITPLQIQALDYLKNNPGTPVSKLSEHLFMSLSSVSQLTDRLFAQKLIDRKSDPDDRRSVLVFLTKKGKQFVQRFKKIQLKEISFITRYMSIEDIEHMIKIHKNMLEKIAESNK
ncbi:MAG: MarR family transcriptional regulator [Candidatus Moranbacteria bacterium]|nr:MarR family transcriptional regulator [Candidatus Moranbacteria bacterium]